LDKGQTEQQKMKIRHDYRALTQQTQESKDEFMDLHGSKFHETLKRTNELHKQVLFPSEEFLDATQLSLLGQLGVMQARKAKSQHLNRFTLEDTIKAIQNKFRSSGGDEDMDIDWAKIGKSCSGAIRTVHACSFMNGPMEVEFKVPERKRREKKKDEEHVLQQAELIKSVDKEETTQTDIRVRELRELLVNDAGIDREKGKNYFEIVINPDSFTQTVENIFDFSFLVKDGYVQLLPSPDGVPMVIPQNPMEYLSQGDNTKGLVSSQTVLSLDKRKWKELVRRFEIKKSFIKTRARVADDVM